MLHCALPVLMMINCLSGMVLRVIFLTLLSFMEVKSGMKRVCVGFFTRGFNSDIGRCFDLWFCRRDSV